MDTLTLPNLEATQSLAQSLSTFLLPGTNLLLQGDLGSGKTTFVQHLGQALGIQGITSPTFTLIQEYWEGRIPLFHMDLYRLGSVEIWDLGLEELWQEVAGVVVIEWSERLVTRPEEWLLMHWQMGEDASRILAITCQGERHCQLWRQTLDSFCTDIPGIQ